jgi:DNA processing protein
MKPRELTPEQKLDWLQLIRCENVGPRSFQTLVNRHGGAGPALAALPELIRSRKGKPIVMATREAALREWETAEKCGARFIALGEPDYPPGLRVIDAPPPLIALRGRAEVLHRPMVAIVGARNASAAGLAMTEKFARGLAAEGYVVVSGLARGIDACAHRAALASGTVGVLAGGLDRIYPPEHAALVERIVESGAVISEMPFGYEPRGRDFPRRNRIVSGLSLGTLVVEAARRSGSLITARFAQEQNREVFAAPGHPLDPRAEGTNDLLRDGAHFCTSAQDMIDVLSPLAARGATRYDLLFEPSSPSFDEKLWEEMDGLEPAPASWFAPPAGEDATAFDQSEPVAPHEAPTREGVEALLGPSPVEVDELARACGCLASELRPILQELELDGRIERHGGDRVSLIGRDWGR